MLSGEKYAFTEHLYKNPWTDGPLTFDIKFHPRRMSLREHVIER